MSRGKKDETRGRKRSEPITGFGRWFAASGLKVEDIRDVLGCSRTGAYDRISGKKTPTIEEAVALIRYSRARRGKVLRLEDFLPDDPEEPEN